MYDMTVYIVRHGETNYNKEGRVQGAVDTELNEYGRELARLTAAGLADVPFDKAFCSPQHRAKETAQIILGDRKVPLYEEARIREISFGEYEGLYCKGEQYNIPDPDFLHTFVDAPERYKAAPGGESFQEVIARTGDFWEALIHNPANEGKTILIASHGAAIRGLMSYIQKLPIEQYWGNGLLKNCAVVILELRNGEVRVVEDGKIYY